MTLRTPLWLEGADYSGDEDRILIETLFSEGVLGDGLEVTQRAAGTNMSVDVAAGVCAVVGDDTAEQGTYLCKSTVVENVVLDAAPGGGNTRIDRIIAQVRDGTVLGNSTHDWVITKVTGTPAGSPSAPALPASAISLATVSITAGVVAVTDAMITDARAVGGVSASLDDDSVTTGKIADGAVTADKIAADSWTAITPTIATGALGFSLGNGSISGRWIQEGKRVTFTGKITLGPTSAWGAGTGLGVALPVTAQALRAAGSVVFVDVSADRPWVGAAWLTGTGTLAFAQPSSPGYVSGSAPFTWANNDEIHWTIVYEAA